MDREEKGVNGQERREIQPEILESVLLFSSFQILDFQNQARRESY